MTLLTILALVSAATWLCIWALPWQPWRVREHIAATAVRAGDWSAITVVIPARNEGPLIAQTLRALTQQGSGLRVIVIDDQSEDGTAAIARQAEGLDLTVLEGKPLPPGWSGKLWALEQGHLWVQTPYTLLLDADIELRPGMIGALYDKAREGYGFVSVLAWLRMEDFWEKLLLPAFVYFFKLLYPFALANSPNPRRFAAAGGCILVETRILHALGGFACIREALIDDCALAAAVKRAGHRTWTGLSRDVLSQRSYRQLTEIWNMVTRTAYTQLHYSPWLLLACTVIMAVVYGLPIYGLVAGMPLARGAALVAALLLVGTYQPTLRYYRIGPQWALLLPLSATLYLVMTWHSAFRYWRGERSRWKGRIYY